MNKMENTIPCCGTCKNSCGQKEELYCFKMIRTVHKYDGCVLHEPKKENTNDENSSSDI